MSTDCRIRPEALDAYFHGMLNEAQQREMSAHLLKCPSCNKTLSALEAETYLIGKGLRNVEIPTMSVSAADLVARYAGTRTPDATTVELPAEYDSGQKLQPAPALDVTQPLQPAKAAKPARLRLVRWIASSAADAAGRRNALATAAAIALVCGTAIWFAMTITRRLDDLASRQMAEAESSKHWKEQQEVWNREEAERTASREQALRDWKENALGPMQQKVAQLMNLLQQQDKDRAVISDLKLKIDRLTTMADAHEADTSRMRDELDAATRELRQRQDSFRDKEQQLADLTLKLSQQPVVEFDPNDLALLPVKDDAVTFEEMKGAQVSTLKTARSIVGWSVNLSQIRTPDDAGGGGRNPTVVIDGGSGIRVVENAPDAPPRTALSALGDWPRFNGPAVANGKVYVGTGWNENGLAAIDASTGQLKWTYAAHDGGVGSPTLSEDGRTVFFTTAGGSIHAVSISNSGFSRHWAVSLGDPVMTQPAVGGENIYVVHSTRNSAPGYGDKKLPYSLTCMLDRDGKVRWNKGLSADAVTSPVVDSAGRVYVVTRDGQISIFDAKGTNVWTYAASATSAPVVAGNSMYFSTYESTSDVGFEESMSRLGSDIGKGSERLAGPYPAVYLMPKTASPGEIAYNDPKKAEQINAQLSAGPQFRNGWSYLGARPTIIDQTAYAAVGDHLVSVDLRRGKLNWSKKIVGQAENAASVNQNGQGQPSLTPPSFANGRLYLGSIWGDMLCVDAEKGEIVWRYRLPESQAVTSQVMLDAGMAYATTAKGHLICINTNDALATGWNMWGGSPSHNGPAATPSAKFHIGSH